MYQHWFAPTANLHCGQPGVGAYRFCTGANTVISLIKLLLMVCVLAAAQVMTRL
jgi:hypothetical protein